MSKLRPWGSAIEKRGRWYAVYNGPRTERCSKASVGISCAYWSAQHAPRRNESTCRA